MAFCLILGQNEFKSQLKGYENVRAQCANCGNWNTQCISRWPWFTACWIPILPLATHKYKDLACYTCNFHQDLKYRPEIQPNGAGAGAGGGGQPPQQGHPLNGYGSPGQSQGWSQGGPQQGGAPPHK